MLRKLLALAVLCVGLASPAYSGNNQGFVYEQHNTSIASATGSICGSASAPATYAVIQVQGANGYYTYNGVTPTTTNGFLLTQNQFLPIYGQSLINTFQIIGAGATINVICSE